MSLPRNPHLSAGGRSVLQRMNSGWGGIILFLESGEKMLGEQEVSPRVWAELLELCYIKVSAEFPKFRSYEVSQEGNRVLTQPNYIPQIIQAKNRTREEQRARRPQTTEELHRQQQEAEEAGLRKRGLIKSKGAL